MNRLWLATLFTGSIAGGWIGSALASGTMVSTGPCQYWACTGTYPGYDNSNPPANAPPNVDNCMLISNVAPMCNNTDNIPCDPLFSKTIPKSYLCRGTTEGIPAIDCWARFWGCK